MEARIPAGLSPAEGRKFGLLVGAAFLTITGILWWRGKMGALPYTGGIGGLLILGGLLIPGSLGPVYRAWMGLALILSKVTTPIFMGIIYFLVITPTGFVMRLVGRRGLVHEAKNDSYWMERSSPPPAASQMQRQF